RASQLSHFARSMFLGIEDKSLVPIVRTLNDQQLGYGGGMLKVIDRFDRWESLPWQSKDGGESDKDYAHRIRLFKASHIPFDIVVPEYNSLYYDLTVDGLVRVAESRRVSVFDIASEFGGHYDDKQKRLSVPVEVPNHDYDPEDPDSPEMLHHEVVIKATREVDYLEYWNKDAGQVVYAVNDTPIRADYIDEVPYFLALGEITSSPDPGRMGLPVLYNAFEAFKRKLNLRGMEDSFLYKHGFARLVHYTADEPPGTGEPELPDQEEEEEVIGELLEARHGHEDWKYLVPADVSGLFAHAMVDTEKEIQDTALADILTGRMPPSGTTGFLMSQLATAAVSKYVPILTQAARAIRGATLYMIRRIDAELESEVVVHAQLDESTDKPFFFYKPKSSRGNENLDIRIDAPLPSDQIAKTQWLVALNERGYVSKERVQREGARVQQPEMENEKIRLETFQQFYEPISMMRAMQRSGQIDRVLEAARAGLLPPAIAQLALQFAAGPEGLQATAQPGANPNAVIQAQPGLGEPGVPSLGAVANTSPASVVKGGGRAAGAGRRPGGPRRAAEPVRPVTP
ncbi:MAG: hypothetical protein Q8N51_19125, partial [Gammaproteobacteria bacterium]|nr:hypothetical protein [Gammaproteobacteria bacterium]